MVARPSQELPSGPSVEGVRVLVVSDDPLARAGLAALLTDRLGCTVAGQVPSDSRLPEALAAFSYDVLVWDLGWDSPATLERLAELRGAELQPDGDATRVVALIADEWDAAEAIEAGATGVLFRDVGPEALAVALLAAQQGLVVLPRELVKSAQVTGVHMPQSASVDLTPRELDVLRQMAEGLSNKAIAHRLGISEHTVKFHVNAILGKLGAQSRTEAVIHAMRTGLVHI